MDITLCAQCGMEIENTGLQFRGRTFCGDECCEQFEKKFADTSEPGLAELKDEDLEIVDDDAEEGVGYRGDDDDSEGQDFDDDDFAIEPDDF